MSSLTLKAAERGTFKSEKEYRAARRVAEEVYNERSMYIQ